MTSNFVGCRASLAKTRSAGAGAWGVASLVSGLLLGAPLAAAGQALVDYEVVDNAIPKALTATPGDAERGRAIIVDRRLGLCLLCHSGPFDEVRFQGNLAPSLAGAGSRGSAAQLRLRMVDARALNPDSIMPSYYTTTGRHLVSPAYQGQPILTAQQIEDVVAALLTLKN